MENIIKAAVERGASDLHIKAGDVFRARIAGALKPLTKQRLTPEQTRAIALRMIPTEEDRKRIDQIRDYDCSWGAPGIGRFRINILRQRSSFMVVMRVIPFDVPTLERLHLPQALTRIADADSGLVLVTGGAGSGKTSTVAALIHQINSSANRHIVTLEDPIEFLHRDVKSSITQRELGMDTESFASGLRAAMRQDPDVIVVGEIPDLVTLEGVLRAAEDGQLVISTLPTPDAAHALNRLVAMFPGEEQAVARLRLAETMVGVVSQRLVARKDEAGRIAAVEVLRATPEIRVLLLDGDRADELPAAIAAGRDRHGTQTFDQHLADLVEASVITPPVARTAARDPRAFPDNG
ncbi:MAG TPA: PilT/PilU family type 4a pilus ATPase [Gemmatimonadales bacterium]|nr:PilT/PilU family type 4a pilus ATPase [Gemmatimonadales bacterium]